MPISTKNEKSKKIEFLTDKKNNEISLNNKYKSKN